MSPASTWRKTNTLAIVAFLVTVAFAGVLSLNVSSQGIEGVPSEFTAAADDWPMANKDYENTRSATQSTITSENVDTLQVSWTFTPTGIPVPVPLAENITVPLIDETQDDTVSNDTTIPEVDIIENVTVDNDTINETVPEAPMDTINETGNVTEPSIPDQAPVNRTEVMVSDQQITGSVVTNLTVWAQEQGWLVIHSEENGTFGPVIGYSPVNVGENPDLSVSIDASAVTPTLYAMLHVDRGTIGLFEFPGVDEPATMDGAVVMTMFNVSTVNETTPVGNDTGPVTGNETVPEPDNLTNVTEPEVISVPDVTPSAFMTNLLIQGTDVYFQDSNANLYVVDWQTGELRWAQYYNTSLQGPYGPAVAYDKVFLQSDTSTFAALDAQTGEELWNVPLAQNASRVATQPTVYDETVYVTTLPDSTEPGTLVGLNQQTGDVVWEFSTARDNLTPTTVDGAWYPPAVDVETGLMYWSIATLGSTGTAEAQDSYGDTLLAVTHDTGETRWVAPVRNLTSAGEAAGLHLSPILATTTIEGTEGSVVFTASRAGTVYCFDQSSSEVLWTTPLAQNTTARAESPMAYENGILYVPLMTTDTGGSLVALDASTGEQLWQNTLSGQAVGTATVVNDVVFTGTTDGTIYAFHARTGEELFTTQAPAAINGGPAVSRDTIVWPCGIGTTPTLVAMTIQPGNETECPEPGVIISRQTQGQMVSWTLPSERRISTEVFGTPSDPLNGDETLQTRLREASLLPSPLDTSVTALLRQMPTLVALPEAQRSLSRDGSRFATTTVATMEGEESVAIDGEFSARFQDIQLWDIPGDLTQTDDRFNMSITFSDPEDNVYTVRMTTLLQPPIPGWETGGGVLTNAFIHGITGTETPLAPRVYAYGAAWFIGDLYVNGELRDEDKMMHLMTIQANHDRSGRLALDEEMPLDANNTPAGQQHLTEFEVLPVTVTADGPVYEPVQTLYTPGNATDAQSFIHVTFLQDTLLQGPSWVQPQISEPVTTTPEITITQPQEGETVTNATLTVSVDVQNFGLVSANQTPSPDEGQVAYFLDTLPSLTDPVVETETAVVTPETTYTWDSVPEGQHTVYAMLVTSDRRPLAEPVWDSVNVTVEAAAPETPEVTIRSPTEDSVVNGSTVTVAVDVSNFQLTAAAQPGARTPVEGQGTLSYFLDVVPPTTRQVSERRGTEITSDTTWTWTGVSPGEHTLYVMLIGNDRRPLDPPVVDSVNVTVGAARATPQLAIVRPASRTVTGEDVTVTVSVQNFGLGTEGSLVYYLDTPLAQTSGRLPAGPRVVYSTQTSHTWSDLSEGTHALTVQLVDPSRRPLSPPVRASVTINVDV